MPFQIMVQDRVPELTLAGMQGLASGIGELGRAASGLFDRLAEKKEQEKKEAKLTKAYDVMGEQLGFSKDKLASMSLEEKVQLVEGTKLRSTLDALRSQEQDRARARRNAEGMTRVMQRLSQLGAGGDTLQAPFQGPRPPRAVTPQDVAGAVAAEDVQMQPGAFSDLVRSMATSGGGASEPSVYDIQGTDSVLVNRGNQSFPVRKSPTGGPQVVDIGGSKFYSTGSGWAPVPEDKTPGQVMELMKTLDTVNNSLTTWNFEEQQSKRSKNFPAPDPNTKEALVRQRGAVLKQLERLQAGQPSAAAVAPRSPGSVPAAEARAYAQEQIKLHPELAERYRARFRELYNEDL